MSSIHALSVDWPLDSVSMPPPADGIAYDGWDVNIETPTDDSAQSLSADAVARRTNTGLPVVSVTVALRPASSADGDAAHAEIDTLRRHVEAAGRVGARFFNVLPPAVTGGDTPRTPPDRLTRYDDALNRVHVAAEQLGHDAERAGLSFSITAPYRGALLSPVELRELIDTLAAPNLGACLNMPELAAVARPEDWATVLRSAIRAVRINAAPSRTIASLNWVSDPVDPLLIFNHR